MGWHVGLGDPRFIVELPYPSTAVPAEARKPVVESLLGAGFETWRDQVLTNYLPLTPNVLEDPELGPNILSFARDSFGLIARSGILELVPVEVVEPDADDADV